MSPSSANWVKSVSSFIGTGGGKEIVMVKYILRGVCVGGLILHSVCSPVPPKRLLQSNATPGLPLGKVLKQH